jgi:hypothetical protein
MTRTTPPPGIDVAALFPGIEAYARGAVRLHPRSGTPDGHGSHVGGPLRWPADEPWPVCDREHVVAEEVPVPPAVLTRLRGADPARGFPGYAEAISELADRIPGFAGVNRGSGTALRYAVRPQPVPSPLVPVAQLHGGYVSELVVLPGVDLLQVLWCPSGHDLDTAAPAPAVTLRWRRAAEVTDVRIDPPPPRTVGDQVYLPRPCVLHPERVVEYPWWQDLPAGLGRQVREWDREHGGRYHRQLATAPGWKIGGWPSWPSSDPVPMYCPECGRALRLLLQIDSGEWGDPVRWRPLEEDGLGTGAEPTGVVVGLTGLYRVFYCPFCPPAPVRVDVQ